MNSDVRLSENGSDSVWPRFLLEKQKLQNFVFMNLWILRISSQTFFFHPNILIFQAHHPKCPSVTTSTLHSHPMLSSSNNNNSHPTEETCRRPRTRNSTRRNSAGLGWITAGATTANDVSTHTENSRSDPCHAIPSTRPRLASRSIKAATVHTVHVVTSSTMRRRPSRASTRRPSRHPSRSPSPRHSTPRSTIMSTWLERVRACRTTYCNVYIHCQTEGTGVPASRQRAVPTIRGASHRMEASRPGWTLKIVVSSYQPSLIRKCKITWLLNLNSEVFEVQFNRSFFRPILGRVPVRRTAQATTAEGGTTCSDKPLLVVRSVEHVSLETWRMQFAEAHLSLSPIIWTELRKIALLKVHFTANCPYCQWSVSLQKWHPIQ